MHTFKAHFISILAVVAPDFLRNLWDLFLPQTEVTLNLLRQATLDPSRLSCTYFHGPLNYDATPLGPLGCHIIDHNNIGTRKLWKFCGAAGWNVGVALQKYCCHIIVAKSTKALQVLETVEFRHRQLTLPDLTPADRIVHGMTNPTCALHDAPAIACDNQLAAIQDLCQAIQRWSHLTLPSSIKVAPVTPPPPTNKRRHSILLPMRLQAPVQPLASIPRVFIPTPKAYLLAPRVPPTQEKYEPITRRTRSRVTHTVDPPPPRVEKATESRPIARRTRSQTIYMANVITPA